MLPLFHEIARVNMKTLRLEVSRTGEAALITKDRMRVDVGVEFYVSVMPTEEGISRAAQTLGDRTFDVEQLREMIEGKLIDGLRAVAAQMSMDELHENRSDFVQEVQNAVSEDLLKNGLALESVSLTALDQTPFAALDENNAFNAVGMRRLAEVIARSKKERAEIDSEAEVAVKQAAMLAAKRGLEIERDEKAARIAQVQELETLEAAQEAELARRREDSMREREAARVTREQAIRAAEIDRDRALEVAEQERQIVVAQKSEEESRARASADAARAEAERARETIETARSVEQAERAQAHRADRRGPRGRARGDPHPPGRPGREGRGPRPCRGQARGGPCGGRRDHDPGGGQEGRHAGRGRGPRGPSPPPRTCCRRPSSP